MIDWQLTCNLLRRHYKPLSAVAKEVGSDWQHMNRLARGEVAEPRFGTGMKILDLAFDVLPESEFKRLRATEQREIY